MKRKLFSWIYPPYLITILISAIALTAFTAQSATNFFLDLSSQELKQTVSLTANAIKQYLSPDMKAEVDEKVQALCLQLVEGTQIRLTVIEPNGRVITDTGSEPEKMDLHLDRPEVRKALSSGAGSAVRKSATTGVMTAYEAIALNDSSGKTMAVIRAAMPFSTIDSRRNSLVGGILLFSLCLALAVSLIAIFLSRRLLKPIVRIHKGAQSFSSGRLTERIAEDGPLEISNLAAVMNRMAAELDERIRTVREQKTQAEAILNGMAEAIVVVDEKLNILATNPAFKKIFGDSRETSLLSLTRNTELCNFVEAAIRTQGPLETTLTLYGEKSLQLRLTSAPLEGSKAVIVINDLTHLNRLETVRRDFTSNVSHELKTPITAIKASLETLKDEGFKDPSLCSQFLGIAMRGTNRLEAIIDDLMSLARVEEEEKNGLKTKKLSLDEIIDSAQEEIAPRLAGNAIQVKREGLRELLVSGHEGLVKQALLNLLDNALKYATVENGLITISTARENSFAVLSITDQGPGIPERDKLRLFERFYRIDKARSRESGGTGLGLAIVKHIALAHSGSVRLESIEGQGSTFSILLPLFEPMHDLANTNI